MTAWMKFLVAQEESLEAQTREKQAHADLNAVQTSVKVIAKNLYIAIFNSFKYDVVGDAIVATPYTFDEVVINGASISTSAVSLARAFKN